MRRRIYLDFDGVINHYTANPPTGATTIAAPYGEQWVIPAHALAFFQEVYHDPHTEVVWASHRQEDTELFTGHLGVRPLPYLVFTDPTGAKHGDIVRHLQVNPPPAGCRVEVHDDTLATEQIDYLRENGIWVYDYDPSATKVCKIYPPE